MKKYNTIAKDKSNEYIVWLHIENLNNEIGSIGCYNLFKGNKQQCKKFCKENKIRIKGGINNI